MTLVDFIDNTVPAIIIFGLIIYGIYRVLKWVFGEGAIEPTG